MAVSNIIHCPSKSYQQHKTNINSNNPQLIPYLTYNTSNVAPYPFKTFPTILPSTHWRLKIDLDLGEHPSLEEHKRVQGLRNPNPEVLLEYTNNLHNSRCGYALCRCYVRSLEICTYLSTGPKSAICFLGVACLFFEVCLIGGMPKFELRVGI